MPGPLAGLDGWSGLPEYRTLTDALRRGVRELELSGLPVAAALALALVAQADLDRPLVLITTDWSAATVALEAAAAWLGPGAAAACGFPPRDFFPYAVVAQSPEIHAARLAALAALGGIAPGVLVLPVTALRRQLVPPEVFAAAAVPIEVGQAATPQSLAVALAAAGYERQAQVDGPGTFAVRGGIVDAYPLTSDDALRIECGDSTITSCRTFSADSQRSVRAIERAIIPPAREVPPPVGEALSAALERMRSALGAALARFGPDRAEAAARLQEQVEDDLAALAAGAAPARWESYLPFAHRPASVLSYLRRAGQRPFAFVLDAGQTMTALAELERQEEARLAGFLEEGRILPEQAASFGLPLDWQAELGPATVVYADALGRSMPGVRPQARIVLPGRAAPPFAGQWTLALEEVRRWHKAGQRILCWSGSAERATSLADELTAAGLPVAVDRAGTAPLAAGQVTITIGHLPAGFELPALSVAVLTENELFGRRPSPPRLRRSSTAGQRLQSYEDLRTGDYVVHAAHGIGQYLGTAALAVQGKQRDYLVLRYEGTDRLYVPTEQIGLVSKYIGGEGRAPRIGRLGGNEWNRAKARVKESVRQMAAELIALYAARQALAGHAYGPDAPWQRDFEAAFPYTETPDQLQAIAEIKADMERPVPMDRLLCGDVGYGKTEVAMRAAFKAVVEGRQVAVLVPTTILAEQHYLTFSERFRGFPVTIGMLSRFRNRREQEETVTALRRGGVDIVIGTHRLLQGDVDFKNLGLVIVDEEHRFGVGHKERLKQLRQTVDVLTMTATPIPRTLHMAMAGIRDMSAITTPPENRYPIETIVVEWSPALIREALDRELARSGQVYYLHNRVQSISGAYERVRALAPEADIVVAHGQMPEEQLEAVTTEFWRGEHQVLLSTTIIESGLDIPNANTIVIEDADKLGLAQLYQIRGRVGRSSRVAYAYFTYRRERALTEIATKRLEAISAFTELGSGFKIALRDLEIRGAGNILGPEQHGFVAAVGFDLYAQLLEEAVRELRGERQAPPTRATVELRVDAFIDDSYIAEPRVKLEFYKRVHAAASAADLEAVGEELADRFGPYPQGVANLLRLGRIQVLAQDAGLLAVVQDGRLVTLALPNYAAGLLGRLGDLPGRLGRRLRVESRPKPALHLTLDATDDVTVLGAVEGCLQTLLAHPALRAWRDGLTEATDGGAPPAVADVVRQVVAPRPRAPGPRRPAPEPAQAPEAVRHDSPPPRDRLAQSLGLVRVEPAARPAPATHPARPAGPPVGRTLRPAAPPGLVRSGRRQRER